MSATNDLETLYLKKLEEKLTNIAKGDKSPTPSDIFGGKLDQMAETTAQAKPIGEEFLNELIKLGLPESERKESHDRFRQQALDLMYGFLEQKLRGGN